MSGDKFIVSILLIFSAFIIYRSNYQDSNNRAIIWTNSERDFFKPVDVVWHGKIISTMAGGSCIGLEGEFDNYSKAMACLPEVLLLEDPNELWKFKGPVTVTGKWFGITCAYKNTIFGECVPDISIESIKSL